MSGFLKDLQQIYQKVDAFKAKYVYIYSDFRYFAKYVQELGGKDFFCQEVVQPFIKNGQTVITTTFTYTTNGRFDVLTTPTMIGALNKWILKQSQVQRSEHPLFSYAAIGPNADFLKNIGKSAFGYDSIFDRLKGKNAVFLHIGRPVSMGNTMLHHVEQCCGATYRINKAFKTLVYRGQEYMGTDYSAFLRRLDVEGESFYFNFTKASHKLSDLGIIRSTGKDESFSTISCYDYDDTFELLTDFFYKDPYIFLGKNFIQY